MFKTLKEWVQLGRSEIDALIDGADSRLRFGPLNVFTSIWGQVAHALQSLIRWAMRQQFASTSDDEYLDAIGEEIGVLRSMASFATGNAVIFGTPGTAVPIGFIFQRSDGIQYKTLSAATILAGGSVSAELMCTEPGVIGNFDSGGELLTVTVVSGVDSATVSDMSGGADEESDDAYRERILQAKRTVKGAGTVSDWERWILDYSPAITRVKIIPNDQAPNNVGIVAVLDDGGVIGGAGFYSALQSHADSIAPIGAVPVVRTPVIKTVSFQIAITPDTVATRDQVEAELQDLIYEFGMPGDSITVSQISGVISQAQGEQDHTLVSPASPVIMSDSVVYEVAQYGGVTWI